MYTQYSYVGPIEIKEKAAELYNAFSIRHADEFKSWAQQQNEWENDTLTITFVVLLDQILRVASRRSEHVACALGEKVLAAGELTICLKPQLVVIGATNQSTGYCPKPECWKIAYSILTQLEIPCPKGLTYSCEFRKCPQCGERNLVKENWFVCDLCGHDLPHEWNFE